ncbi:putative nuclease HARBI1 [Merluccius polli]|uniref:Nuclease HARBI1 n=1 Tax=Merluccius polli TaxID=89951 RepID=A0AA47MRR3_MERPO|nr:putative nuclease HARBI1 [Merluccius polli]
MACPFLEDVLDEEALILRRAFRHERVFRDRSDPLAFGDDYLNERYRFSDGLCYIEMVCNHSATYSSPSLATEDPSGEHEGDYVNRKSFHSINVQIICDADCLVSLVSLSGYSNFRVTFTSTLDIMSIFSGVLLGDKGYACKSFLLTLLVDPNPITAGLQPCTQQNKGSYQDDLRPSEISVSVPAPPEGFPGQGLLHVQ